MIFFLENVEFRACPVEGPKTIAESSRARKCDLSRNVVEAARLAGKPRERASQGLGDDDERSESRRLFRFIHFLVIVYTGYRRQLQRLVSRHPPPIGVAKLADASGAGHSIASLK